MPKAKPTSASSPVPPTSNSNRSVTLQIDEAMLPMILSSYEYGATRAMLCGDNVAFEQMKQLAAETRALCPPVSLWFDGAEWFELIQAIRSGHSYALAPPSSRYYTPSVSTITIFVEALGIKCSTVGWKIPNDEAHHAQIIDYLDQHAPMRD